MFNHNFILSDQNGVLSGHMSFQVKKIMYSMYSQNLFILAFVIGSSLQIHKHIVDGLRQLDNRKDGINSKANQIISHLTNSSIVEMTSELRTT